MRLETTRETRRLSTTQETQRETERVAHLRWNGKLGDVGGYGVRMSVALVIGSAERTVEHGQPIQADGGLRRNPGAIDQFAARERKACANQPQPRTIKFRLWFLHHKK
eukprot:3843275-Prymnesium_polylepis.1